MISPIFKIYVARHESSVFLNIESFFLIYYNRRVEETFWIDWNISERGTSFQLLVGWVLYLPGHQIKGKEEIGFVWIWFV